MSEKHGRQHIDLDAFLPICLVTWMKTIRGCRGVLSRMVLSFGGHDLWQCGLQHSLIAWQSTIKCCYDVPCDKADVSARGIMASQLNGTLKRCQHWLCILCLDTLLCQCKASVSTLRASPCLILSKLCRQAKAGSHLHKHCQES